MRNDKNDKLKHNIETFFEEHNAILQIIICVLTLIISSTSGILLKNSSAVIITLLTAISVEVVLSGIKDSALHRKVGRLVIEKDVKEGRMIKVSDYEINPLFEDTRNGLFVSGIALNGFFGKYKNDVINLLKKNKKIYVLIVSPDVVEMQAKIYHGATNDETELKSKCNAIIHKQATALEYLKEIDNEGNYIKKKSLIIKTINIPATTSFVAHDVIDCVDSIIHSQRIKASFYQYRCTDPEREPNVIIDSSENKIWFDLLKATINRQWEDGKLVHDSNELKKLIMEVNSKIDNVSLEDNKPNNDN